jgi:hypothetical protein
MDNKNINELGKFTKIPEIGRFLTKKKFRKNQIPVNFVSIIEECESCVKSIITKAKLTVEQENQKKRTKLG